MFTNKNAYECIARHVYNTAAMSGTRERKKKKKQKETYQGAIHHAEHTKGG